VLFRSVLIDSSGDEIPCPLINEDEYSAIANKTNPGSPMKSYYDPQFGNGILHVWPVPEDSNKWLSFPYKKPIMEFDALGDIADFPVDWYWYLVWALCYAVCPKFGVAVDVRRDFKDRMLMAEDGLYDIEGDTGLQVVPDFS